MSSQFKKMRLLATRDSKEAHASLRPPLLVVGALKWECGWELGMTKLERESDTILFLKKMGAIPEKSLCDQALLMILPGRKIVSLQNKNALVNSSNRQMLVVQFGLCTDVLDLLNSIALIFIFKSNSFTEYL